MGINGSKRPRYFIWVWFKPDPDQYSPIYGFLYISSKTKASLPILAAKETLVFCSLSLFRSFLPQPQTLHLIRLSWVRSTDRWRVQGRCAGRRRRWQSRTRRSSPVAGLTSASNTTAALSLQLLDLERRGGQTHQRSKDGSSLGLSNKPSFFAFNQFL